MRKVSALVIIAAAIVGAAGSLSKPVLAQDKAAEVLSNMRKAIGDGKLDSLRTFSLEGKTARNIADRQMTSNIELYLEMPDKYLRVDNITAPMAVTMTAGFNGDKAIRPSGGPMGGGAQMVVSYGGPVSGGGGGMTMTTQVNGNAGGGSRGGGPMTPEQQAMVNATMIRSQRVELSRMMLGWFGQAHPGLNAKYTYAGEAESPDGKAHIIDIKADGGFEAKLFVDQATSMPLMVTYQGFEQMTMQSGPRGGGPGQPVVPGGTPPPAPPTGGTATAPVPPPAGGQSQMTQEQAQKRMEEMMKNRKMIEYRVFFGDWKEVDGIQFPHTLQRAVGGTTTEEWTISKVKVNPKIDAKKFSTQ
ncbi:MAG: hypothetical protein M3R55_03590 [Acidobacteriota bacterium]|nr:hypothetical protein [Acidobacteriota bacterium]